MKLEDEHIGGMEIQPVRFRFKGDLETAQSYAGLGRNFLGGMKYRMQFNELLQLREQQALKDGTVINTLSITGQDGNADIDEIWIDVTRRVRVTPVEETPVEEPPVEEPVEEPVVKKTGRCLGFIVQTFPDGFNDYVDEVHYPHGPSIFATLPNKTKLLEKIENYLDFPAFKVPEGIFIWSRTTVEEDHNEIVPYNGYPDNGALYLGNPIAHSGTLTELIPEYEAVVVTDDSVTWSTQGAIEGGSEHAYTGITENKLDWHGSEVYKGSISEIIKRTDNKGFITRSGFSRKDGVYNLQYQGDDYGYSALFMIPMAKDKRSLQYATNVVNDNTGSRTGVFFDIPVATCVYKTLDTPFGVPCVVAEGTYKVRLIHLGDDAGAAPIKKLKIYLLTEDDGLINRTYTNLRTKYDSDNDYYYKEIHIRVGEFTDIAKVVT